MKQPSLILLTVILSVISAATTVNIMRPDSVSSSSTSSTKTIDRIIKTGTIRCGYAVWPPSLLKDPNTGKLSGINYDVMELIGRELDLKIDWVEEVGFSNFIEGLKTQRYDVMCVSSWPDAPRIRHLLYTDPYFYSPIYAYVRTDDKRFDGNLDKINDPSIKIATIDGDISETQARIDYPKADVFSLPQTADPAEVLLAVVSRKADIVFTDKGNFELFNKNNPGVLKQVADVGPATIFSEPLVVLPGETQLHSMLNLALGNLINNGKIDKVLDQYPYGDYLYPARTYKARK